MTYTIPHTRDNLQVTLGLKITKLGKSHGPGRHIVATGQVTGFHPTTGRPMVTWSSGDGLVNTTTHLSELQTSRWCSPTAAPA